MNKQRRERIAEAINLLDQARDILDECKSEEEDYLDNMPENLQQGEKGDAAQSAIDSLESAIDSIDDAVSSAEEI